MTPEVQQFHGELMRRVGEFKDSNLSSSPYTETAFTELVIQELVEAQQADNLEPMFFEGVIGAAKLKVTGQAMEEDEQTLTLCTTVLATEEPPSRLTPDELRTAAERCLRFFTESCKGMHERLEPSNTDATDLARRIADEHQRISIVTIVIMTDAEAPTGVLAEREHEGTRIRFEVFDIVRLFRVLGEGQTRSDIEVDLRTLDGGALPALEMEERGQGYDAYLSVLPGALLAEVYERYGTRLLELNVRAFLGIRGRKTVNSGLRETLLKDPGRFLAYNNGIVATIQDLECTRDASGLVRITRLKGLQIVNGGQTTASLHRARRVDRADLASVHVPAKIIHITQDQLDAMVAAISRSANSQNTVQPADFSANDPFHREVENLSTNCWLPDGKRRWFYERARGTYGAAESAADGDARARRAFRAETPKERRFTKTDLSRYVHAWNGKPHDVSRGSQKNFQLFMQGLKDTPILPDQEWYRRLISAAIIYRATEKIARDEKFPAYRANIVAYTVAALGEATGGRIDFDLVWREQDLSEALKSMIREWTRHIDRELRSSAGNRMPTEWAKKAECWEGIRSKLPRLPTALPNELARQPTMRGDTVPVPDPGPRLSREDLEAIQAAMAIDATVWLETAAKGRKSKVLKGVLPEICKTLAEYAANGWERRPSVKQARAGLGALERVRANRQ